MKKFAIILSLLILMSCQEELKIRTIQQYHYEITQSGKPELVCGFLEEYNQAGLLINKKIYNEYNEMRWEYSYEYDRSGHLIRESYREPELEGINDYDMIFIEREGDHYRYQIDYFDETVYICQTEIRKPGYLKVISNNDGDIETEVTWWDQGQISRITRDLNGKEYFSYLKEDTGDGFIETMVNDSLYTDIRTVRFTQHNDQGDWTRCDERWVYQTPGEMEVENGMTTRKITYF